MSTPAKSPASKTPSKKKKGNGNPLMLPGLDKLPKKGGKPVVVVVVKGGKNPPNLSNLPFLMKMKKKKISKKKSSVKSGDKKSTNKTEEESDLSESDRVSAPELPKAHTKKQTASTSISVRSDKSVTGGGSTSSTSINSISLAPISRTPQLGARTPKSKRMAPTKISTEPVVIQGGIIDRPCVPMFILIDGPVGHPIIVPLDARDENGLIPEGSPPPFKTAPKEDIKGYMVVEDGLLHFKPLKECPQPPPCSTSGTLTKFLSNSNIFIADEGPKLPDEKEINTAPSATIKEKLGYRLAISGHITILPDKGTCKFTRVCATTAQPFCPDNGAMGVLIKDRSNSRLFWVPTENRYVGPLLSQNIKIPVKPTKEMSILGNIYKASGFPDASGIITFESPSNKLDNLIGFIMSSATGVPMYASKPEGPPIGSVSTRPTTTPSPSPSIVPTPVVLAAQSPPPSTVVESIQPPSRDEISPPPIVSLPSPSPPSSTPSPAPTSPSPAVSPPVVDTPATPSAPTGPSLGWSLLSTLGSVLTTTATVISTTAGAVTEAAAGTPLLLLSSPLSPSQPPPPQSPPPVSASPPPSFTHPSSPVVVPVPTPTKTAPAPKAVKTVTRSRVKTAPSVPPTNEAADEEAAIAAEEAAAAAAAAVPPPQVADASSNGVRDSNSNGVRDSNSTGAVVADEKSGETFSDALSDGGTGIGEQMASIYRNLLSSQNELPPEPQSDPREEESKNEEKMERKAKSSISEESRRKAETTKEYKKYMDDRSVSFSPYGYR
ncbi:hypothetical protein PRIPAC_81481 [Pristionchus pacificus]|uniref:Uncharacterized protein n=1 Tax=Pristionchus pacificus TaxID=54126 RepID=A0A2A6CAS9_PRIPA|nr:hypothetical protein PRIPAC_81481 [Pristionchus pacificus]|eukprot:PDM75227.1 hypothetical protein PRIPAC_43421 [Pristionchus pacificus]